MRAFAPFDLAFEIALTLDMGFDLVVVVDFLVRLLFDFAAGLPGFEDFAAGALAFACAALVGDAFLEPVVSLVAFPAFLLAFTLRTPVTAAVFLTFATSAPRLCNGRRVVSGSFRYGNLGVVVTYVNRSSA
ncbi:MAG TPA: hypothetical protein VF034_01350 [Gemmatimonadaceae bacterium]